MILMKKVGHWCLYIYYMLRPCLHRPVSTYLYAGPGDGKERREREEVLFVLLEWSETLAHI